MMNKVWIVMRHDHKDYPNCNVICTVCATEDLAEEALLWFESGASKTQEFWIEDHSLDAGSYETPQKKMGTTTTP